MRNQWRQLLLLRCYCSSAQMNTSLVHRVQVPSISYSFLQSFRSTDTPLYRSPFLRFFSSELGVEPPKDPIVQKEVTLLDVFSKTQLPTNEIKLELEASNVVLSHDSVLEALGNLRSEPDVARRLFDWVLESENEKILSSESCNLMLGILVENGFVKEFWDLVEKMKKKEYGVLKATSLKALERFEKDGLDDDVKMLSELFVSGSDDNSIGNICTRVCRVIRHDQWSDDVEKQLRELNVEYSSELVSMVVGNLGKEDDKGLMFFKWIEESGLFKHDEHTFNAMVKVLAMEDSSERFWKIVEDMRKSGFEIEKDTYLVAMTLFIKKKNIHDAVDLWEFAMGGMNNKPSVQDSTFLIKKIVSGKELDMDLFSLFVKTFKEQGNVFTDSMFESVLKCLISANKLGECNKILKALEEDGGFIPSVVFRYKKRGKSNESIDNTEPSDSFPDHVRWSSLIYVFCLSGDLEKASSSLQEMVENVRGSNCHCAIETVVRAYCRKKKAINAFNLVSKMIKKNDVHPWYSTFMVLIRNLLVQKFFKEALNVVPLMKAEGYPPPLRLFIKYLKSRSPDEAMAFFEVMSAKKFPPTSVFLRLFEAYFKLGRNETAQDLLLKSPSNVRDHPDVLNLFFSKKSGTSVSAVDNTASLA